MELLAGLGHEVLERLAGRPVRRRWGAGEVIVEQDAPAGSLLVLHEGAATVYRSTDRAGRAGLTHLYPYPSPEPEAQRGQPFVDC